jgi:hypothetical protein
VVAWVTVNALNAAMIAPNIAPKCLEILILKSFFGFKNSLMSPTLKINSIIPKIKRIIGLNLLKLKCNAV